MQELQVQPRRRLRGIIWLAAFALTAIALLGSTTAAALAVTVGTPLHQTPPISSASVPSDDEDCDGVGPGQVLWHFVLVQTNAASGTIDVNFANAGASSWPSTKKTGKTLHFDVWTGADTLLGASTPQIGKLLNLSHVCVGETETTTTTDTVTTTTEVVTTTSS